MHFLRNRSQPWIVVDGSTHESNHIRAACHIAPTKRVESNQVGHRSPSATSQETCDPGLLEVSSAVHSPREGQASVDKNRLQPHSTLSCIRNNRPTLLAPLHAIHHVSRQPGNAPTEKNLGEIVTLIVHPRPRWQSR